MTKDFRQDAKNFEPIGNVEGAGNSSKQLSYTFVDNNPYQGISYYRLKQTDYDGKYAFSDIIIIKRKGFDELVIKSLKFNRNEILEN